MLPWFLIILRSKNNTQLIHNCGVTVLAPSALNKRFFFARPLKELPFEKRGNAFVFVALLLKGDWFCKHFGVAQDCLCAVFFVVKRSTWCRMWRNEWMNERWLKKVTFASGSCLAKHGLCLSCLLQTDYCFYFRTEISLWPFSNTFHRCHRFKAQALPSHIK